MSGLKERILIDAHRSGGHLSDRSRVGGHSLGRLNGGDRVGLNLFDQRYRVQLCLIGGLFLILFVLIEGKAEQEQAYQDNTCDCVLIHS